MELFSCIFFQYNCFTVSDLVFKSLFHCELVLAMEKKKNEWDGGTFLPCEERHHVSSSQEAQEDGTQTEMQGMWREQDGEWGMRAGSAAKRHHVENSQKEVQVKSSQNSRAKEENP